ncbi:hypothetical protein Tco_1180943, partial [Tanacetum coccineum]
FSEYSLSCSDPHSRITFSSDVTFSLSGTHGLVPVPSLEVAEMNVDSSRTPGMLPVPSLESLVPGCLLLVF